MGITGWWQWVVVAVLVLLLFGGRGRIQSLMGDMAGGIKAFKKGLKEENAPTSELEHSKDSQTVDVKKTEKTDV
jgi:sec-independent protein translocase protein TatA